MTELTVIELAHVAGGCWEDPVLPEPLPLEPPIVWFDILLLL